MPVELAQRAAARSQVAYNERRMLPITHLELRAGKGDGLTFDGIASMVDTPYSVWDAFGEFTETINAGAFDKTMREDVRLLVNHEGVPLARTKSGTLELSTTPHLRVVAPNLDPANPDVKRMKSAIDRGDMDQMSIGFSVPSNRQKWSDDYSERWIREVKLFDVSVVTFPASETTSASLRALDTFMASMRADMDQGQVVRAIRSLGGLLVKRQMDPAPDDTPAGLAAAIDAVLDEAMEACAGGNDASCLALMTAAAASVDALLALLGVPDADDESDGDMTMSGNMTPGTMLATSSEDYAKRLAHLWDLRK